MISMSKNFQLLLAIFLLTIVMPSCAHRFGIPSGECLEERESHIIVERLRSISENYKGIQGRFQAKVIKPGVDMTFRGTFRSTPGGYFRMEIYSPMGIISHLLEIEAGKYRFVTSEVSREGQSFQPVPELVEQWGITISPYAIINIFTGYVIDHDFYQYGECNQLLNKEIIMVSLRCIQNMTKNLVFLDRKKGIILKRYLFYSDNQMYVGVEYHYDQNDKNMYPDLENQSHKPLLPLNVDVWQHKKPVKISIFFSDVIFLNEEAEEGSKAKCKAKS